MWIYFLPLLASISPILGIDDDCPPIPMDTLPNGNFIVVDWSTVELSCDPGFVLLDDKHIYCRDGEWYPKLSKLNGCIPKQDLCSPPPDVRNADKTGDERNIGVQIFYHCHEGYRMEGPTKIVCTDVLQWDKDPPKCHEIVDVAVDLANRLINQMEGADDQGNETSEVKARFLGDSVFSDGLELFILFDRSSSVDQADMEMSKNFLGGLLNVFKVDNTLSNSLTRLCVIQFGDAASTLIQLDDITIDSTEKAMEKINAIKGEGGGTAMQPALSAALKYTNLLRKGAKRALFLLTDGEPNVGDKDVEPEDVAKTLKKRYDFEIFTVGVGRDVSEERMKKIASEPAFNHAFMLTSFQSFKKILDLVRNPPTPAPTKPPPSPSSCGLVKNGTKGTKPWLTSIVIYNSSIPEKASFCAGVLLCKQWVLTSAACFPNETEELKPNQINVRVAASDLTSDRQNGFNAFAVEVYISAKHSVTHFPEFRFALVKLNQDVPMGLIRPVCLPIPEQFGSPLSQNVHTQPILEGWGTRQLGHDLSSTAFNPFGTRPESVTLRVKLMDKEECVKKIKGRHVDDDFLTDRLICTGTFKESKTDPCAGNLGSPLIALDKDERHRLLGIQGQLEGCQEGPIIYLDPLHYVKWIDQVTGKCAADHID